MLGRTTSKAPLPMSVLALAVMGWRGECVGKVAGFSLLLLTGIISPLDIDLHRCLTSMTMDNSTWDTSGWNLVLGGHRWPRLCKTHIIWQNSIVSLFGPYTLKKRMPLFQNDGMDWISLSLSFRPRVTAALNAASISVVSSAR